MFALRATVAIVLASIAGSSARGQIAHPQTQQTEIRRNPWVVADFNGDDKLDLVSLSSLAGEPHTQLGPLESGLLARSLFTAGTLRARDLDGDKDRDLVLETEWSVVIAVWINDGAGHFTRANLEDFRFQLSRDDSRHVGSTVLPLLSELTDESPRYAATTRPCADRPRPSPGTGIALDVALPRAALHTGPGPRGPPSFA